MLKLLDIHTFYGESYVLQGISLEVRQATVVAILGRNGMGKTTTLHTVVGLTPPRKGKVFFKENDITGLEPHRISRFGIALVPQGRRIFPSLSVTENLTLGARQARKGEGWSQDKIYSLFPVLQKRAKLKGNLLSGGEQQMLAISRALLTNPELLLMDEPSEGLAPIIVRQLESIIKQLHKTGLSILLVEQNMPLALSLAADVYILNKGVIAYRCTAEQLRDNEEIIVKYLGASAK